MVFETGHAINSGRKSHNRIDMDKRVFGRLTVEGEGFRYKNRAHLHYNCVCKCGTTLVVAGPSLRQGNTQSCGCLHKERTKEASFRHGLSRTSIHNIWSSVIARCECETSHSYKAYGGRGITVCDRWHIFENFLADMGIPPKGMSLERKDNDKGYSPDNCIWADKQQQANNRRSNKLVTFNGKTQTLAMWERELGLYRGAISARLKQGWSVEKALSK